MTWNNTFLNKALLLCLTLLSLSSYCGAQCPTDCYNESMPYCCYNGEWGSFTMGVSAVKLGGLNSLPIAVREHPSDGEGWEGKLYTLRFNWHPAWEIGLTKNLCRGGSLGLQYWGTHLHDSFNVNTEPDGILHLLFAGGENSSDELTRVKARTDLDIVKVALSYTDLLKCNCHSRLDWYAALTFYYFGSDVKAEGFDGNALQHFTKNKDINYLIGPTTGIFYNYYWYDCLSLYLNANLTVSYNSHRIKRIEGPIDIDAPMDFYYQFGTVLPIMESALGFTFSKCKWNFSAEYGFKWFYHLFDSAQQIDDTNDAAGVSTPYDIAIHGVTLRAGRCF